MDSEEVVVDVTATEEDSVVEVVLEEVPALVAAVEVEVVDRHQAVLP